MQTLRCIHRAVAGPGPSRPVQSITRHTPPHLAPKTHELPENISAGIRQFRRLCSVERPVTALPGPPLHRTLPKGRRKRGRTYSGEGLVEEPGGIWDWVVTAQVKEGTENRGSIEAVVRQVRKTLLSMDPPLPLPPNSKRRMLNGWAMIDAGKFAVHILSRDARRKYFERSTAEW
ncbi:uncharacterized protein BJ212DRAFT_1309802 [Suillus subaureus]|uniref:Uncharacterized protein n=1 Tax=Suillus subaureus TaxID=48587 RepID=A0A9P7END3_9AGAM|nr:uncharacterized protein BJ212DRAFT_1309802 [Suillus subaureus]KAG1827002.1 hypothetical protein BJ212DRAFT_1309802 [Suillus subaureus]